ncbi:hypothetical protein [Cypionkella psychrotolerans]|uniref:hypothetical protein n=1 Tax=Cypionkella psychrotolerans TaxID=1678131 RepID=UPI0006B44DCF|nr:hypothetical protein [Cypionkella psychrotolerans]
MKSPKTATQVAALEAPAMPIPPHGGSFVLNEEANTLTHVPLPVAEPDTVEEGVKPPIKLDSEEAE